MHNALRSITVKLGNHFEIHPSHGQTPQMSEPRRSTRTRAREEAVPAPPPEPADTPSKPPPKSLKRKRPTAAAKDATPVQPAVVETTQEIVKPSLPVRLIEGQPLPTLSAPQPLDLPSTEYQDVRQRWANREKAINSCADLVSAVASSVHLSGNRAQHGYLGRTSDSSMPSLHPRRKWRIGRMRISKPCNGKRI